MSWNMDSDIDWSVFDSDKVEPGLLQIVKSAALVEANASDYVTYLCRIWPEDEAMHSVFRQWGREETQHGLALARWASLADPDFDFPPALERFRHMQNIDTTAERSIRGSATGELIARCVVETGTSSLYAAIRDVTDEPVLKQLSARIAADEFAHYALFSRLIKTQDPLPRRSRLKIALGRLFEASDDELASAYFCAADRPSRPLTYERKTFSRAYQLGVMRIYQRKHINRLVAMIASAGGLKPHGLLSRIFQPLVWFTLNLQKRKLLRTAVSHI
ncbi:MAG TPA: ferritin-like domain-containing protein [Rhizobiales bacterium]|nr:ferritin-like domain-containing protein [Hyphomicrobiales bacterium]